MAEVLFGRSYFSSENELILKIFISQCLAVGIVLFCTIHFLSQAITLNGILKKHQKDIEGLKKSFLEFDEVGRVPMQLLSESTKRVLKQSGQFHLYHNGFCTSGRRSAWEIGGGGETQRLRNNTKTRRWQ